VASFACYAERFRATLRVVDLQLGCGQAFRLSARALFYHFFVPLSVGNDLTRFTLCRAAAPPGSALLIASGIVLDHVIGTAALLLLVSASGVVVTRCGGISPHILAAIGLAGGLLLIAGVRAGRRRWSRLAAWRARLGAHRPDIVQALLLSLVMQNLLALAVYQGAQGWGIEIGYREILWVLTCGALLQVIPLNLGGLHLGDVLGAGLYVALGLPLTEALLLCSLLYCFRLTLAMTGGVLDALPGNRRARRHGD
jgi:uncharacterized membrane protein YbhN (UPF0104 family)